MPILVSTLSSIICSIGWGKLKKSDSKCIQCVVLQTCLKFGKCLIKTCNTHETNERECTIQHLKKHMQPVHSCTEHLLFCIKQKLASCANSDYLFPAEILIQTEENKVGAYYLHDRYSVLWGLLCITEKDRNPLCSVIKKKTWFNFWTAKHRLVAL